MVFGEDRATWLARRRTVKWADRKQAGSVMRGEVGDPLLKGAALAVAVFQERRVGKEDRDGGYDEDDEQETDRGQDTQSQKNRAAIRASVRKPSLIAVTQC